VREGDRVRSGDLLCRLEDADLRAAVEQAEAAVGMAEANRENAVAQHDRMVELHGRGSVTDKNLEDAVSASRVAEASVRQALAALAAARVSLSYAEVRSPVSGWVVARRTEVGNMAAPGAPLFTIEDLSRVKIVLQVPEADVVGLEAGGAATVEVDVLQRELPAAIHRVMPAGDPSSRTYEVQLVLDNPDGALRSGMFVRGRFARGDREGLRVPRTAVVHRGQLDGLFVVDEAGRARLRWVRLGRVEDDRVLILSGLEAGERFVVDPPVELVDATPVRGAAG
jgi:multidrug efflux system membrane fusion protein